MSDLVFTGLIFLAGGIVKGILGIGLPLLVVPLMATLVGPLHAIATMFVPTIASNVMQARQAGLKPDAVRRFWPAIVGVIIGAFLGSTILSGVDKKTASVLLAIVVVLFCLTQLLSALPTMGKEKERWFTPVAGATSGLAGGLTGFMGLTLVPYLLSLRLAKEEFVATIAMLYLCGVLSLYGTLFAKGVMTGELLAISAGATIPTLVGVWLGSLIRKRVSEERFRKLLIVMLLLIAANLLRQVFFAG